MAKKTTRNAQGTGNIRKKTVMRKGKEYTYWEGRYTIGVDPGTGKQIQKSITGKTQKEVTQKMRTALHEISIGTYREPMKMTVAAWLDTWLAEYVTPSCKPLTVETYRSRVETHIKPAFGNTPLQSLSTVQIQALLNGSTKEKNLAPKTVKNLHGILHKALEQAVKLRYITFNPADACELPRMTQREIKPLTENEIAAFLTEIAEGEPLKNLFTVALFTGMREGEICGLSWDAVNFADGTITVKQQLQKGKEKGSSHYVTTTKNGKARIITVAPYVMKILKDERLQQGLARMRAGSMWVNDWNLVFTREDGSYIPPQTALKHFKAVASRIGRPDARFHDLRHTYAVTSIQEGDDIKTVQQNLGHATASFTLDVYGHVSEKMKQESAARMERFISKINA